MNNQAEAPAQSVTFRTYEHSWVERALARHREILENVHAQLGDLDYVQNEGVITATLTIVSASKTLTINLSSEDWTHIGGGVDELLAKRSNRIEDGFQDFLEQQGLTDELTEKAQLVVA